MTEIRLASVPELDRVSAYLEQQAREERDGQDPPSSPYNQDEPYDAEDIRERNRRSMERSLVEINWRRMLIAEVDGAIVGNLALHGGFLETNLHRATLGLGVLRSHRRRGIGRALMEAGIDWSRGQPTLSWLELGVFSENRPAIALYASLGFVEQGRIPDRFRIDGQPIEDIIMSFYVGDAGAP